MHLLFHWHRIDCLREIVTANSRSLFCNVSKFSIFFYLNKTYFNSMLSIFFMTNIWRFIDYIFNNYLQVNAWSVIVRIESINYWNSYTLDLFYIHVELWGIFTTLNANKHTEVKKKRKSFSKYWIYWFSKWRWDKWK